MILKLTSIILIAASCVSCITVPHPPYRYNVGDCLREAGSDIEQIVVEISSSFIIKTKFSDRNGVNFYNTFTLEEQMELGVCK